MRKSCSKCLYTSEHPFDLNFKNKVCSGCITHDEKDYLDWKERYFYLESLISKIKRNKRGYDCIVPVIGDAEDFYTLSKVISLGMSPLIVSVNDYFKNDIGWQNFHQLITHFDVDSIVYNPDIRTYKELVRTSLRKHDHVLLPFLQLHTSFPVHVAYERKIPLVIWGQNQSIEQVGKFSHLDEVKMSRWSRRQHDLFEIELDDLIGSGGQINRRYCNYYNYPKVYNLDRRGIQGIYLSNYFRWDPLYQNKSTMIYGFQPEKNYYSFDTYERAGSSIYYKVHDLLKYKRNGYKKIRDHLTREIRHKRISRSAALKLEAEYLKVKVNIKHFFDWLEVSKSGYEWFKKHRLSEVEHLITESNDKLYEPTLPSSIKKMISKSKSVHQEFLLFDKGIDITIGEQHKTP